MNKPVRLAVVAAAAFVLTPMPLAHAEPSPSPTPSAPKVVPAPAQPPVEWPVQDLVWSVDAVVPAVDDLHFSTASVDGANTESDGGREFVLKADVMFAYNKASLTSRAQAVLTDIATKLSASNPSQVIVVGHTDSDGSDPANLKLSQLRAKAVMNFLATRLPKTTTVKAVGRGETQPRASNLTKAGRALNRRVEITIPS